MIRLKNLLNGRTSAGGDGAVNSGQRKAAVRNSARSGSRTNGRKRREATRNGTKLRFFSRLASPFIRLAGAKRVWKWLLLLAVSAAIALTIYPAVLRHDTDYQIGDVAPKDIKATRTYLIEDEVSTEERRREARQRQPAVYDYDDTQLATLTARIDQAFELVRESERRQAVGETLGAAEGEELKAEFEAALGLEINEPQWRLILTSGKNSELREMLVLLLSTVAGYQIVPGRRLMMDTSDRQIIIRRLSTGEEHLVNDFYPMLDLETAGHRLRVEVHGLTASRREITPALRELLTDLAVRLLRPNLNPNLHETDVRRTKAAAQVKPVFYQIRRGEMLVREGERITPRTLVGLRHEAAAVRDGSIWMRTGGVFLLLVVFLRGLYLSGLTRRRGVRFALRDVVFVSVTILFVYLLGRFSLPVISELTKDVSLLDVQSLTPLFPAAVASLLVASILGLETAVLCGLAVSLVTAMLAEPRLEFFVLFSASSLVAARSALRLRKRSGLVRAGLYAGLTAAAVVIAIRLIGTDPLSTASLVEIMAGLMGGVLSGVVAAGLFPLVEALFGYTTDFKLQELAHLDQPVLKELLFQAPGSYHHSVVVANMAEAAAEEIGANPLLCKAAALYHDIGKVKKPLYFIENQTGENRHERLAPSMSALILISHVKDGVEIAAKAKLGRELEDMIAQHHGTSLISYFYEKAKQTEVSGREKINIDDFRYPGPKPQTREAGLVMLADQAEAACKSLADPTPARIKGMVQKIVNRAFTDGQLSDCELTLRDLHAIAKCFIQVLTGLHHQRIAYPDDRPGTRSARRKTNGDTTPKRTSRQKTGNGADNQPDSDDIKRLGTP